MCCRLHDGAYLLAQLGYFLHGISTIEALSRTSIYLIPALYFLVIRLVLYFQLLKVYQMKTFRKFLLITDADQSMTGKGDSSYLLPKQHFMAMQPIA